MLFCGIEKNSLNDFPEKISCVIFTSGCNFYCPYCHNPQTVMNKHTNSISEKEILNFIKKRKSFYDGVVISGGEPTLNQQLPALCTSIKEMGYHIKLDTNGSRPDMLMKLINANTIDYIAMDLKTYPTDSSYRQFTNEPNIANAILKSIKLIMSKAPDYEFRTTCVNPFINIKTIEQICSVIKNAKRYTLQPFNKNAESILNKKFFVNKNPVISKKDITSFVNTAKSMVKHCSISLV